MTLVQFLDAIHYINSYYDKKIALFSRANPALATHYRHEKYHVLREEILKQIEQI